MSSTVNSEKVRFFQKNRCIMNLIMAFLKKDFFLLFLYDFYSKSNIFDGIENKYGVQNCIFSQKAQGVLMRKN